MKFLIYSLGLKGFNVVRALSESRFDIDIRCVIGRDGSMVDDFSDALGRYCANKGIEFSFRGDEQIKSMDCDYALTAGWRWIINDLPEGKLIVFHDSLLPTYRGFAPLVNALLNKETQIGVSVIFGVDEYDKGNIIAQKCIDVTYPTCIQTEIQRIADLYAELAVLVASNLIRNDVLISQPQDEEKASYSLWRDEDDYRIDWQLSAQDIQHFIACVGYPYLGASAILNRRLVRIYKATALNDVKVVNRSTGKVIFINNGCPVVVCGSGLLLIEDGKYSGGESLLPLVAFRSRFN